MPSSANRPFLTALHSLPIVALLLSLLAPVAAIASPNAAASARLVAHDNQVPSFGAPEPVILIPEPETPVGPFVPTPYPEPAEPPFILPDLSQEEAPCEEFVPPPSLEAIDGEADVVEVAPFDYNTPLQEIPLNDIFGDGVTPMPSSEPLGIPALPVARLVSTSKWIAIYCYSKPVVRL